jgi:23S rRNA (adenine2503-C2)-methyltransferase
LWVMPLWHIIKNRALSNNMSPDIVNLKNLSVTALGEHIAAINEPRFRISQIMKWIYQSRVDLFDKMKNLPKNSQKKFSEKFSVEKLKISYCIESKKKDAIKFGFNTSDNSGIIESVLLCDNDRRTACISSQLGCGLGCVFCATGAMGFIRNLSQQEIIGQLIGINDFCAAKNDRLVTNIVFMGMGEALSNFDAFISSLQIIMHEDAFTIGARRITVSTAGVVPSINRLIEQDLTIGLAISLNTYDNRKRDEIMPINKKYPIEMLVDAAKRYEKKTNRPVTFEYVVVEGENDSDKAINALALLLKGVKCKINVIPVNPCAGSDLSPPSEKKLTAFADALLSKGLSATVRKSRGRDISGACGQLSGKAFIS